MFAFLISVFKAVLIALFLRVLVAITFTRFFADLMLGIIPPPYIFVHVQIIITWTC